MNFKTIFLAIAVLFMASQVSAYYYYGGSYGALEYPNSYYNYSYSNYGYSGYGAYSYNYNFTPYSTYYSSYSSGWSPYSAYYAPAYYAYPAYYGTYNKAFYWDGLGFSFAYLR